MKPNVSRQLTNKSVKKNILKQITKELRPFSETPAQDAQVLLAWIIGKTRAWVLAHPELELTPEQEKKQNFALEKLKNNTPLPYVIGHWEFFGLDFLISDAVLIPRPETEELVERSIAWLRAKNKKNILDAGTGSGIIPISIARNLPDLNLVGVDISESALGIARQNAAKYGTIHHRDTENAEIFKIGTSTLQFLQSNLLANLPLTRLHTFNLITANLPYIPTATLKTLDIYTREPTLALDGGKDGLDLIRKLLQDAPRYLAPKGLILLEIDSSHGKTALKLAKQYFPKAKNKLFQDLSGRDRFISVET